MRAIASYHCGHSCPEASPALMEPEPAPAPAPEEGVVVRVAPSTSAPSPATKDEPAIAPFLSKLYEIVSLPSLKEVISW